MFPFGVGDLARRSIHLACNIHEDGKDCLGLLKCLRGEFTAKVSQAAERNSAICVLLVLMRKLRSAAESSRFLGRI